VKIPKLVGTLCGAALFFASGVVAGELNKTAIHLDENVTLEGKILNIGNYTAEWKGSGPNVQVTLLKGKDAIATFPARLKDENNPNAKNAYGFTVQPDGSKELTSIFPGGKRFELQIDQKASPATSNPAQSR
jgi:hypothetical protein